MEKKAHEIGILGIEKIPLLFTAHAQEGIYPNKQSTDLGGAMPIPVSAGVTPYRGETVSWGRRAMDRAPEPVSGMPQDILAFNTATIPTAEMARRGHEAMRRGESGQENHREYAQELFRRLKNTADDADDFITPPVIQGKWHHEKDIDRVFRNGEFDAIARMALGTLNKLSIAYPSEAGHVLTCHENLGEAGNFCHRRFLAKRIGSLTGLPIPDISDIRAVMKRRPDLFTADELQMHPFQLYRTKIWAPLKKLGAGLNLLDPSHRELLHEKAWDTIGPAFAEINHHLSARDYSIN